MNELILLNELSNIGTQVQADPVLKVLDLQAHKTRLELTNRSIGAVQYSGTNLSLSFLDVRIITKSFTTRLSG